MSQTSRAVLPALLFALLAAACGDKKDDAVTITDRPVFNLFTRTDLHIDTVTAAARTWQYGFRFQPLTQGAITQIGLKIPGTGSYQVRLYDLDNDSLLYARTIAYSQAGKDQYQDIPAVAARPSQTFGVTVTADEFFRARQGNGTAIVFPFTSPAGTVQVLSYNEDTTLANMDRYPTPTNASTIAPCVDVTFTTTQ